MTSLLRDVHFEKEYEIEFSCDVSRLNTFAVKMHLNKLFLTLPEKWEVHWEQVTIKINFIYVSDVYSECVISI